MPRRTTTGRRTEGAKATRTGETRRRTPTRRTGGRPSATGRSPGTGRQRRSTASESRISAKNVTAQERRFLDEHKGKLSPTTLRAKWVHSPDEHEDRAGQSLATQSPDVIRAWAEGRRAQPATVKTQRTDRPRTLRMDFPGYGGGGRLEPIDWDQWLDTFRRRKLVFLFQEHKRDGNESNFFRLDSPERERG
jgi:hypothetical protein